MSATLGPWIALLLSAAAIAACAVAITARSLTVAAIGVFAAGVGASAAAVMLGAGGAGVALAAVFAGWTPVLLLAAVALTTGAVKTLPHRRLWPAVLGAALALGAFAWAAPDFAQARAPHSDGADALWAALIAVFALLGAVALLGFGERGGLAATGRGS